MIENLKQRVLTLCPSAKMMGEYEESKMLTIEVPNENWHELAVSLRNEKDLQFDYLQDIIGVDEEGRLGIICRLFSTTYAQTPLVVHVWTDGRERPELLSVSDVWNSANLYEREVYDYFGIRFVNHPDMRRLFLRPDWVGYPLRKDYDMESNPLVLKNEPVADFERSERLELDSNGRIKESSFQLFDDKEYVVSFGPQHPSTHGVLQLRVSLKGETVQRIDPNFGYIHRGIEKMCEEYTYPQILHLTERLDYLSAAINRHGMCLLCEKALQMEVPERAVYIRTIFDELTRIASHLLGWASMCNDMGAITAFIYGMRDREKIMDIFEETTGGRLFTSYSVIGGVSQDIHPNFQKRVKDFLPYMRKMLREYHTLFTNNPIARQRMTSAGHLNKATAIAYGVTGPSGRASGWHNDVRKIEPYAAYSKVNFNEVTDTVGGSFERYYVRLDEILESLAIIEQLVDNIPEGDYKAKTKAIIKLPEGEFFERVENARGDFGIYVNSHGDKSPYRIKFRSPSMALVSALEPIVKGEKIADLIMIGGSLDYVIPCIDR